MEDTTYVVYIFAHTTKGAGVGMRDEGRTLVAGSKLSYILLIFLMDKFCTTTVVSDERIHCRCSYINSCPLIGDTSQW
jgi:hypothetical protein